MHISFEICINIRKVIKRFCDLVIRSGGVCMKNANYYLCMHLSSLLNIGILQASLGCTSRK